MAWRGLRERPLASALTALSVALGVGLVAAVLLLERAARGAFHRTAVGVEVLVAGNKGSRIDALLSTLCHVGRAPGRVAWPYYEALARDPRVEYAIPLAVGDRYRGAPVVGAGEEMFRRFLGSPAPATREAVAGAEAGLSGGDVFFPSHSGIEGDPTHRQETFRVRTVAAPTGTAHDRAIWIGIEDFLGLEGHEGLDRGEEVKALSAVLLKTKGGSPLVVEPLIKEINDGTEAQAIRPVQVVGELFALLGDAQQVLAWVAVLVVAVALLSVAISLHSAMAERRREIAVLRALGARRGRVFRTVLLEAALLCAAGALLGLLLAHGGAALLAPVVEARAGVRLEGGGPAPEEPLLVLALFAAGCAAGVLPAVHAYRVDVARGLE